MNHLLISIFHLIGYCLSIQKVLVGDRNDSTEGRAFALYVSDPGLILKIPYGYLSITKNCPKH